MTLTEQATEEKAGFDLVAVVRAATPEASDRRFWATLTAAWLLHLMLLLGFLYSPAQRLGNPNAVPEAVAVSFVSEAELLDASAGADGAPPPSAAQPAAQPPPQPQPEEVQQEAQEAPKLKPSKAEEAEKTEEAKPAEKADEAALPEPAPDEEAAVLAQPKAEAEKQQEKQEEQKAEEEQKEEAKEEEKAKEDEASELKKEIAEARPDLLEVPDLFPQPRRQPARKRQQQARRDPSLSLPQQTISTPSLDGRAASVSRPAGITRSGANDDFARGVIQALRQTMPQMNVLGRVTVKILINMNGNLETVTMLSRSQDTVLNRSVVFSTKQASFPFPPNGATLADRTFTITYIYH